MLTIHNQLFLSFHLSNLDYSIIQLQNAVQAISSSISAKLLTLNTSKTEFLFIGLKQQLAKINSCSLDTVHSARNPGFNFDEHLTSSDRRYLLFLNPATHIFVNFDASLIS